MANYIINVKRAAVCKEFRMRRFGGGTRVETLVRILQGKDFSTLTYILNDPSRGVFFKHALHIGSHPKKKTNLNKY